MILTITDGKTLDTGTPITLDPVVCPLSAKAN